MEDNQAHSFFDQQESSACGVGFVAVRGGDADHFTLQQALGALTRLEHRGGCGADRRSSDGAGVMTDLPFELFDEKPGRFAVASLFLSTDPNRRGRALDIFERTFGFMGLAVRGYRDVPVNPEVLGEQARSAMPVIRQAVIDRPKFCRTLDSFEKLLYTTRQMACTKIRDEDLRDAMFFCSLSAKTLIYKALSRAADLAAFYPDLANPVYKTRFALFHRRFSTNTSTSWDKAQPFRMIGHNGEINTIAGNRSWSTSREMSMGLPYGELLTRFGISDSANMNEMVEALKFRSSITRMEEIMAILMPPAHDNTPFYRFWGRAMEPLDGPAMIAFADGDAVGARLDRNGFRPGRWCTTHSHFYLASEAGPFQVPEVEIVAKGALAAGSCVTICPQSGYMDFSDPGASAEEDKVRYHSRLITLDETAPAEPSHLEQKALFLYTREDMDRILIPMILTGKEPLGSMGDTARPAIFSDQPRTFFDYFYQNFAQVTNPPLDYLREEMVTDLTVHLGRKPNIFSPKELIPPAPAIKLSSPVVSLSQMACIDRLPQADPNASLSRSELAMTFSRKAGAAALKKRLEAIGREAIKAVKAGASIIVLSDRTADEANPPIPSLLALRSVVKVLNRRGLRLRASIVVHSGEIRETHHVAALIGFGAAAVCPYLALEIARYENHRKLNGHSPEIREERLLQAFASGLLKVMAKMGISVVRGYQSSKLFTPLGLDHQLVKSYFLGLSSPISGLTLEKLAERILRYTENLNKDKLLHTYQYKEHNAGLAGEKHAMTNKLSKMIHHLVRGDQVDLENPELFDEFLNACQQTEPTHLRHLFQFKTTGKSINLSGVETRHQIMRRFGSGAMSFGAISAESQRDIFKAMRLIGGRSNSGEGGENPFHEVDGTRATTKQIASGRFGVTATYLAGAEEFQLKMAQGAKPGEGGQLMGVKVTDEIAKARHARPGVDLISPPPMHDIYSIEDLKELIYELKQFNPKARVSVKLVSGANLGAIAVGVAKAGADIIQISGGDGGTGAAPLSSMKHAGLPWELGLIAAHRALVENGLRDHVTLRVDGGLQTGRDIVSAAILGAEEFDFGKLLLVAQGCVMARICEKNTCPTGIAVHNPKFKAKYVGNADHIVRILGFIAEDVRRNLASLGVGDLSDVIGRTDLLEVKPQIEGQVEALGLDLSAFLGPPAVLGVKKENLFFDGLSPLNRRIVEDAWSRGPLQENCHLSYAISNTDRGVLATLARKMAEHQPERQGELLAFGEVTKQISFRGSAGQGFGAFMTDGMEVALWGEANDSVGKSMSGGLMIIRPEMRVSFKPEDNAILGNGALYGATGGVLYAHGRVGDRFAVRNSGATAVVEGAGMHACEYMTGGTIVFLGPVTANMGAGMTGGEIYLFNQPGAQAHGDYLADVPTTSEDELALKELIGHYYNKTGSARAGEILGDWPKMRTRFTHYLAKTEIRKIARVVSAS